MGGFARRVSVGHRIERLLGPGAAVLLGAASAFFCFAMPAAIVAGIVHALRLPPAVAESRLALALALGLAIGAATWFGFAALDRAARPRAGGYGAPEGEEDPAPVLRRADAHPDAPARRPIFAGADLGVPLDLIDPLPIDWAEPGDEAPAAPLSTEPVAPEPIEVRAPEPAPAPEPMPASLPAVAPAAPVAVAPIARVDTPAAPAEAVPTLSAMMARLETSLARKALEPSGAEPNVTAIKREIRPVGGTLLAAVDELQQRTAARH